MSGLAAVMAELGGLRKKQGGDVYISDLDIMAKRIGRHHDLSIALWQTGNFSARLLATRIADAQQMTEALLETMLPDLDSWDICDGFCAAFVRPTPFAVAKSHEWTRREPEFEKRAAFSTMAQLAWKKNEHPDEVFMAFLPLIEQHAGDERYYVKKAVNWALRDIGKRNDHLAAHARMTAARLQASHSKTTRWVGSHRISEIGI